MKPFKSSKPHSKIQKGIFCYLNNRGLSVSQMRGAIKQFYKVNDQPISHTFDQKQEYVCNNFSKFKKYIKQTFVISYDSHMNSYEDWWEERNLDGSFAYNGVTDDF